MKLVGDMIFISILSRCMLHVTTLQNQSNVCSHQIDFKQTRFFLPFHVSSERRKPGLDQFPHRVIHSQFGGYG
jgi:hypothetical protein